MIKQIELTQVNLRFIRKSYFKFTLEQVSNLSHISISTIRNAELGKTISKELLDRLFDFYIRAEKVKRDIKAHPEVYRNV